ncbi:hypothetical protein F751_0447 [Auxenochlorella protothecoides]|uniref:Uncharacterized protein n=1 Tax=Auxenochlorella protothecoides TaxID=3075 RepID=A0A087SA97_AUXPR|nr:hypothetical protein F751_0447 [Auxenochlorella protothecoides]KFM22651.1 hypothetical protein F751_0447 [Auxenochlorella protothecoides]
MDTRLYNNRWHDTPWPCFKYVGGAASTMEKFQSMYTHSCCHKTGRGRGLNDDLEPTSTKRGDAMCRNPG